MKCRLKLYENLHKHINDHHEPSSPASSQPAAHFSQRHSTSPVLHILFKQEVHDIQEVIQKQHLTENIWMPSNIFLSHIHAAWRLWLSSLTWSFPEPAVFNPPACGRRRWALFCPCGSRFHLLMISKWTRNWFQIFKELQRGHLERLFTPGPESKF